MRGEDQTPDDSMMDVNITEELYPNSAQQSPTNNIMFKEKEFKTSRQTQFKNEYQQKSREDRMRVTKSIGKLPSIKKSMRNDSKEFRP